MTAAQTIVVLGGGRFLDGGLLIAEEEADYLKTTQAYFAAHPDV